MARWLNGCGKAGKENWKMQLTVFSWVAVIVLNGKFLSATFTG